MAPIEKRLLIVDDEPNVTLTLSESLEALGAQYQVHVANSGSDALNLVRQTGYDIIVTDYRMPGMTGLELAQEVHKISPATQIILMTAYGSDSLRNSAESASLSGFIDKPFTIKQIRDVILRAIQKTSPDAPDPFRNGQKQAPQGVRKELDTLQANTGARTVILISSGGYPIETSGQTFGLDLSSVGALVAANFVAANELARLLGNNSIFKTSYHEGDDYNIYAYGLNSEFLLAVVFGQETKPGTVWFYTKQSAITLNQMLDALPNSDTLLDIHVDSFDAALDDLFGEDDDARASIMSFDEAVKRGILPRISTKD
jgi:CheY-like chemotaxis protein